MRRDGMRNNDERDPDDSTRPFHVYLTIDHRHIASSGSYKTCERLLVENGCNGSARCFNKHRIEWV
jgi:hypothetical protein